MEHAADPAAIADDEDDAPGAKKQLRERLRGQYRSHPARTIAVAVAIPVVIALVIGWYLHERRYESTDDAQIDADISAVSPRVVGTVIAVHVVDNQLVHAGDPLVDLDPRDLDAALAQARAGVAQAEAQLRAEEPTVPITAVTNRTTISTAGADVASATAEVASAERELERARAEVAQAEADDRYAEVERERVTQLARTGAVAPSQADRQTSAADAAAANLEAKRKAADAAKKRVDESRSKLAAAQARHEQARANAPKELEAREANVRLHEAAGVAARAELEQAELARSYARIVAPVDGVVGRKSVNVGDRVQPGQQLLAITQTARMWVTANFRETQIRKMTPGQRTVVHVDALGLDFRGSLESLPGATGARYSLLPPENATGNYVKVVQRLPVRIALEPGQRGYERLRPGMSVEPKVTVE